MLDWKERREEVLGREGEHRERGFACATRADINLLVPECFTSILKELPNLSQFLLCTRVLVSLGSSLRLVSNQ